jgi:hypothetical protein
MPGAAAPYSGAELFDCVQSGESKKCRVGQLIDQATASSSCTSPLAWGAVGNGIVDDTVAVQTAVNVSIAASVPICFDGSHKYLISSTINVTGIADLEGFAPVGNDGVSNAQTCLSGIFANSDITAINVTGEKVIINNMCIQMAPLGSSRLSGTAIQLGGVDQQHSMVSGNTIFRPYYGIEFGGAGGKVRDSTARDNVVRDPTGIGITVGRGTTGGISANETVENNRIGCDAGASGTGIGFAMFDGSVNYDGTNVGPSNCAKGTEVVPGASQNVNGFFKGVYGDSSGTHNGGAQAYELYIKPQAASGVIEWAQFIGGWAGAVVNTSIPIYVAAYDAAHNSNCSNLKFVGVTAHSDDNAGTAPAVMDIEGCQNIAITGSTLNAWLSGTTTDGIHIGQASGNPAHIAISGSHIGIEAGATLTNGVTITGTGGGPAYISFAGNELNEATNQINFTPSTYNQVVQMGDNSGVDDTCNTSISSATTITLPASAACVHVTGTTTVQNIIGAWGNRRVIFYADNGLTLATGGTTYGFCNSVTIPAANVAYLINNQANGCWAAAQ